MPIADSKNVSDIGHWTILENGGDGWKMETDCAGADQYPIPSELQGLAGGSSTNFATSYEWCAREQVIDLRKEGFSEALLDERRPPVFVSEW